MAKKKEPVFEHEGGLSATETIALSKAVNAKKEGKDARAALKPGNHVVDFTVRIHGTLKVGEDTTSTNYPLDSWAVVAALLSKLKRATGENTSLPALIACAKKINPENVTKVKTRVTEVIKERVKPEKPPKKGAVSSTLLIESVS